MAEQNNTHTRPPQPQQSSSYPSPHSYPSPSMNPSYTYPPPQGQPANEPYRASPTASNAPMGNLNLPPIRAIDGQSPAPPSQQAGPPSMSSQLPPPTASMGGYYAQAQNPSMPPGSHVPVTSPRHGHVSLAGGGGGAVGGMRYQLPPQPDQRMMSGGRHKKEIKRRTKTGCLTCRKRRIKCDEAHPVCRNCQKSKRECAGYDPIFKQQPGPAQIQPAPVSAGASSAPVQTSSAPASYSNIPQGYAPAVSSGYPPPANSTSHSTAPPTEYSYDFNASIDPALAGSDHAQMPYDGQSRPDVKGPFSNNGMYPGADRGFQVKKNRVEDLFAIANIPVPPIPSDHALPSDLSEIREVYTKDYAPGLDRLLDTTWYTQKGLEYLLSDKETMASFSYLLQLFRNSQASDYNLMRQIPSLEAKTGWQLVSLCRRANSANANGTSGSANQDDLLLQEAKARLDILEHLITGHTKDANPLLHLPYGTLTPDSNKFFETGFWKHLGTFVTLRDDDASSAKEIEGALAGMRGILHQQENRDVIYSVAIIRHVGTRMSAEFPAGVQQAYGNQQEDDRNKLFIARKFLEDEAQNGMTQVISRVAGMAVRSWHVGR